jgi:hypothetical protein
MGFSVTNDGTATSGELNTWLISVDTLVKAFFNTAGIISQWDNTTKYSSLQAYSYPALGGAFSTSAIFSTGVVGTGAGSLPTQNCLVLSLRSGRAGRRGRGRMYYPMTVGTSIGTNGQLTTTTTATFATALKTLFDAINVLTIGASPSIVCIAGRDSGVNAPVTGVTVDTKIDTQRRRTDKIVVAGQSNAIL